MGEGAKRTRGRLSNLGKHEGRIRIPSFGGLSRPVRRPHVRTVDGTSTAGCRITTWWRIPDEESLSSCVVVVLALAMGTGAPQYAVARGRAAAARSIAPPPATRSGHRRRRRPGSCPRATSPTDAVGRSARRDCPGARRHDGAGRPPSASRSACKFDTIPFFTARVEPGASSRRWRPRRASPASARTAAIEAVANVSTGLINAPAAWAAGHTGAGMGGGRARHRRREDPQRSWAARSSRKPATRTPTVSGGGNSTTVCPGGVVQSDAVGSGVPCTAASRLRPRHARRRHRRRRQRARRRQRRRARRRIVAIQVFTRFDAPGRTTALRPAPCTSAFNSRHHPRPANGCWR